MARRWTFEMAVTYAKGLGVIVERDPVRREYNCWKQGQEHTEGVSKTIPELLVDIQDFANR